MWLWLIRWCTLSRVVAGHARANLRVHPSMEIWLGVPDLLSDPVPTRAITSPAPDPEGFHFNAKKARYLRGF
jgi:hypothetical protein